MIQDGKVASMPRGEIRAQVAVNLQEAGVRHFWKRSHCLLSGAQMTLGSRRTADGL